jgi:PAS domain S-box-containing protein
MLLDLDGTVMFMNHTVPDLIRDEVIGTPVFSYVPPDSARAMERSFQKVVKTGKVEQYELSYQTGDGETRHLQGRVGPVKSSGRIVALAVSSRDVTEGRKAHDALQREKEFSERLINSSIDGILAFDREYRCTVWNSGMESMSGKPKDECLGRLAFEVLPFLTEIGEDENFRATLKGKTVIAEDRPYALPQAGREGFFEAHYSPLRDESGLVIGGLAIIGLVIGGLAIIRDITDRKEAEEELKRHTEHLEDLVEERSRQLRQAERMAAIGETTSMVGHDLRNPLQAIVNNVYLANMRLESAEAGAEDEVRTRLNIIREETGYMNKIVSDLQDYAGPVTPSLQRANMTELVDDVFSTLRIPDSIKLTVAADPDFPPLVVDPHMMKRVFTNLVTNALQAMPTGGDLTIGLRTEEGHALLSIGDTGVGIPEDNVELMFRPLFTTKSQGQGFGLAVCKRLVEEVHRGSITVKSKVGEGSTFTIRMPLKTA